MNNGIKRSVLAEIVMIMLTGARGSRSDYAFRRTY